jgi:hypothetical protein
MAQCKVQQFNHMLIAWQLHKPYVSHIDETIYVDFDFICHLQLRTHTTSCPRQLSDFKLHMMQVTKK